MISESLEQPLNVNLDFMKWGKIRCVIIFEDGSQKDFYKKLTDPYFVEIKNRYYLIIPKAIIRGKPSTITWYWNNPFPLFFEYERSKLTGMDLYEANDEKLKEVLALSEIEKLTLTNVKIDSESLKAVFSNKFFRGLYGSEGLVTKNFIIILIVVVVVVLIILQVTGVVDVAGWLGIKGGGG